MPRKSDNGVGEYIARSIKEGRYKEIAVPEQRSPDAWVPLERQHTDERKRGWALNNVITSRSPYITTVLKPATGMIAAVAVDPPQESLLKGVETDTPIHHLSAAEVAKKLYGDMLNNKKIDLAVASTLMTQTGVTYEQLISVASSRRNLESSLRRLRDFRAEGFKVLTSESLVEFKPHQTLNRYIPSDSTVQLEIRYCGTSTDQRTTNMVILEIPKGNSAESKLYFLNELFIKARLSSIDNLATLKLLQAAQIMDLNVECLIGRDFDLKTQKWVYSIIEIIDTTNLITQLGPLGAIIQEMLGIHTKTAA